MSRAGYVLVGGRSARMGRDKALLPYRGVALAEWVARAVEAAAGSATLVGSPQKYSELPFPCIADERPGEGPLSGILAALAHTGAEWNLIAACDMPGVRHGFLMELLDAAEAADVDALIPAGPSGRPEPLCAVYNRRARPGLENAFLRGERKVMAAAGEIRAVLYPVKEMEHFRNVNTPEEWSAHAR